MTIPVADPHFVDLLAESALLLSITPIQEEDSERLAQPPVKSQTYMLRRLIKVLPIGAALLALAFPAAACVTPPQGGNCCPEGQPAPCGECPADQSFGVEDNAVCVAAVAGTSTGVAVSELKIADLEIDLPPADPVFWDAMNLQRRRTSDLDPRPSAALGPSKTESSPTYLVTRRLRI